MSLPDPYFVYLNWVAAGHTACVHLASCSYCRHGVGTHPGSSDRNGKWLPDGYSTLEEAKSAAARELPDVTIRLCGHCLKSSRRPSPSVV